MLNEGLRVMWGTNSITSSSVAYTYSRAGINFRALDQA
jgi:hypothetical protein